MRKLPIFISMPLLDANNWKKLPLLIHEAAHIADFEKGISDEALEELRASRLDPRFSRLALYWTQEVVADLLAVRYLGPSYLKAFLNSPDFLVIDSFTETHPPINDRLRVLLVELENMGFDVTTLTGETRETVALLPAISLDQRYSSTISSQIRQKCAELEVDISNIELGEVFDTVHNKLSNCQLVLKEAPILLNVVYDDIDQERQRTTFERSLVAQYLRQYLGTELDAEALRELGLQDIAIKIQLAEFWFEAVKRREALPRERGVALENYFRAFLNSIEGVEVTEFHRRTRTAEIDMIATITGDRWRSFSPYLMVECKNLKNAVTVSQLRNFVGKLETGGKVKLGIFVSVAGFTRAVKDELLRLATKPYTVVIIEGKELEQFHSRPETPAEFLHRKIRESVFP